MHIVLTSSSKIKVEALETALKAISNSESKKWPWTPVVSHLDPNCYSEVDQCPQPLDEGGFVACRNRITIAEKHIKSLPHQVDYIISVENYIHTQMEVDIALCICYNVAESWETVTYSDHTPLYDSPNSTILKTLLKAYPHKDGATETYGKLLNKNHPEIPHDN